MRLAPWIVLALCVPAALASSATRPAIRRADFTAEVSPVVYPEQSIPLVFSHARHLRLAGVDCADCHAGALESRSSLDQLVPGEDRCVACHAIERDRPDKQVAAGQPAARCAACHVGFDAVADRRLVARVSIPIPNLRFDHKAHRLRGLDCRACHGDLGREGVELATRAQLPPMALCTTCHDDRQASGDCTVCHLAAGGGRIMTEFAAGSLEPSGSLMGDAHDMSFRLDHRAAAESNQGYCASCHKKDDCIDCHVGVMKPLDFHGNDYVTLHSIDARRGTPDCTACHRLQTFCVGCHSRAGVSADGKGSEFVPPSVSSVGRRFHPPGWVEFEDGEPVTGDDSRGEDHHSFQAQRNIRQCAACHRETFCLSCHSAQPSSRRINPHPDGWRGSRRCESLRRKNGRMCLRCHTKDLRVPACE